MLIIVKNAQELSDSLDRTKPAIVFTDNSLATLLDIVLSAPPVQTCSVCAGTGESEYGTWCKIIGVPFGFVKETFFYNDMQAEQVKRRCSVCDGHGVVRV